MKHAATLKLSLLVSLGLVPLACGGTSIQRGTEDDTSGTAGTGEVNSGGSAQAGGKQTSAGSTGKGGKTGQGGAQNVAGTSSVAGTAAIGGTGSGGASPGFSCTSPKLDPVTGLVTCDEGYRHRPTAKQCEVSNTNDAGSGGQANERPAEPLPRATGDVSCTPGQAGECSEFVRGYCSRAGNSAAVCQSGCLTDAECGAGNTCICSSNSPTGGVCTRSSCNTDADCSEGSLCASHEGLCDSGGFACIQTSDECLSSADCGNVGTCSWDSSRGHRACSNAVCGRPFLVEAETRVAPTVSNGDWSALSEAAPRVDHLSSAERAALAEHWTHMGQMEHASIAAFARFSLQLLALGAPPELVEACTRALSDETAHTRLCFRIASAYAGQDIGPGALDVSGNLLPTSMVDIVELVIAEGCFGETSAALEALQAAEAATDPVIAAAYARIAVDEQRHAELAFRFVRWALERGGAEVTDCVASAIEAPPARDASALGVALPCLSALLAASERRPLPSAWA